jgi:hypothetical protein
MEDVTLYTLVASVSTGVLGLAGGVLIQWVKSRSDEKTHADKILTENRLNMSVEMRSIIEILKAEREEGRTAARQAVEREQEADGRWREARDLALRWEEQRHQEHGKRLEAEALLREAILTTEIFKGQIAKIVGDRELMRAQWDDMKSKMGESDDQRLRLLDEWTLQSLEKSHRIRLLEAALRLSNASHPLLLPAGKMGPEHNTD